jgi:hypothetical protein
VQVLKALTTHPPNGYGPAGQLICADKEPTSTKIVEKILYNAKISGQVPVFRGHVMIYKHVTWWSVWNWAYLMSETAQHAVESGSISDEIMVAEEARRLAFRGIGLGSKVRINTYICPLSNI